MTLEHIAFTILSAIAIGGAFGAVTLRTLTRALLSLVAFFVGVAGMYFFLRAEFIGTVHLIVYVGAVAVLVLFAIVLTREKDGTDGAVATPRTARADVNLTGGPPFIGIVIAGLVGAALVAIVLRAATVDRHLSSTAPPASADNTTEQVGEALMTRYALPFEAASLLLTAALIGAVVVAMDERKEARKKGGAPR